jgi:hypothetical protein
MKRIVVLFFISFVFLIAAAWVQTVTVSASTNDGAQNENGQNAPCGTGCLCSPPGLIGWWAGDGNARDVQGAALPCLKSYHVPSNGILMNGARYAWGFVGPAFSFDGVDDYVDVPDTQALHAITTAITVEAWIKPQIPPDGAGWILARRDPFESGSVSLSIRNDGFLMTNIATTVQISEFTSLNPIIQFNGEWQHIAVTADTATGQLRLYLNGKSVELDGSPNVSGIFADVSHLFIGQRQGSDTPEGQWGACHYKGLIDEVGLYNRALTPEEIQAIYFVGHRGRCKASF